jgi:LuxR family transcriptional regulator, maltose regulon positive regulatory protein
MLLTKLHIPASGTGLVQRQHLYDKLNEGLKRKLMLISAPAGFGKSTLVSEWIKRYKIPAAWFSIDSNDNDMTGFLSYIIAGIQQIKKTSGENALKLLKSPSRPGSESVISLLINDIISIDRNFILVLDDFHLITNKEIIDSTSYLLEYLPENTHLVILSRSDPNLPVARLRSRQQLIELRSSDLCFSAHEIAVLFNKKLKTKLSVEDIHSLETKTEGWIAGLQLAALSMQGHKDSSAFIRALAGNNRYIMDYLIDEVLKVQPPEVKSFLLKTSILQQFSAPLCNSILDRNDSRKIIEKIENDNMFIFPLDTERNWYRYHHLFADLLKQQLSDDDKTSLEDLHSKACEWYEQNDLYNLAIEHALAIKNYEKSIQLSGHVIEELWENGMHEAILNYGDTIPDKWIKKNPEFCLYYSWILITAGQLQKAMPFLTSAEQIIKKSLTNKNQSDSDTGYNKQLLGKIAVALAYLHSHEEHSEKAFDYCKTAMQNLSDDDTLWSGLAWFSYGVSYASHGKLAESRDAFDKAFEYGKKSGNVHLISTIVMRMAENEQQLGHYTSAYKKCTDLLALLKEWGYSEMTRAEYTYATLYFIMGSTQITWMDLDRAYENIKIAYDLSKGLQDIFLKTFITMVNWFVLKEVGDFNAENRMMELEKLMKENEIPPFITSIYIGWKLYLLTENDRIEEANRFAAQHGIETNNRKTHINETVYQAYARLLLIQGKLEEAEKLISELFDLVYKGKKIERMIDLNILYAMLFKMKGNREKALSFLVEAMNLAVEENLVSFFVYNVNYIEDLIDEVFKIHNSPGSLREKIKIPATFLENLKQAIEKKKRHRKNRHAAELSTREIDTLKLMAGDLSNQEIADELFISINTVKTHVKNILLKLDTDSRSKAAGKARELGIL